MKWRRIGKMEETREERIARLTEEFRKILEEKFPEKGSTLDRIEELTEEIGKAIEEKIEDDATKQEGKGYVGRSAMCRCGKPARYVRVYEKEITTLHGLLVIPRAYYHCSACKKGFAPLDEALKLDSGSTSRRVRGKVARISALTPFGRGANELRELCGIAVSAKTFERVAENVGEQIGEEVAAAQKHILSGLADIPKLAPERLYITVDGVTVPVGKGYRECKVGAVYEATVHSSGDVVAKDIEHVATMGNAEAIGDRIYAAAFRRGVESAKEVVVVADGGRWIWKQARENFPNCVQILDFFHAAEHLSEVASAWYGAGSKRSENWLETRKKDLLEGRFDRMMRSIRAWKPNDPEHEKIKKDNIGYFLRNKKRMRYSEFIARHLHIGSGIAESSCKCLVQARLKQSGMHWTEQGAESILQLRRLWMDVPTADFSKYSSMPM
jgi:hypothetical protein